jgi:protein-disulfide isomerase
VSSRFSRRTLLALAAATALAGVALAPQVVAAPATASSDEMAMGDPKAKVTVIEYGSVACPICAEFNNTVFPGFKKDYVDTGKVRYVFREALTGNPTLAASGFLLARCAGPAHYFKVTDAVFRAQSEMYEPGTENVRPGVARATLSRIARSVGLSDAQMNKCLTDPKALQALNDRVEKYTRQDFVSATPTFIINGSPFEGFLTLEQLGDIIRPLLAPGNG